MNRPLAFCFVIALSSAGCTKAVTIIAPVPPIVAPLTSWTVQFASDFDPPTFHAELDGGDVTPMFAPSPVGGGTSTMRLLEGDGFNLGTWIPRTPPPPDAFPRAYGIGTGTDHGTPMAAPMLPAYPPGSVGPGAPVPSIALFSHTLVVSGRCKILWCSATDELYFLPVHLVALPQTLNVKVGALGHVTLQTYPVMSTELKDVRVRLTNTYVRVGGGAPGPYTVNISPPPASPTNLYLTGQSVGSMLIYIEHGGTQYGTVLVNVD